VIEAEAEAPATTPEDDQPGTARALAIHVLRMIETRVDAAGIALQSEIRTFTSRLQLRALAAAALFLALWGGIVLLAIALPPHLRIPVLSGVIIAFVIVAVYAYIAGNRAVTSGEVGSLSWFFDSLKMDVEVLSRGLSPAPSKPGPPPQAAADTPPAEESARSETNDLAA
jgi:uncharacterized membrane protein YqjE